MMTAFILTPTTDTVWGWLILAILAVIVTAGGLCLSDVIAARIRARGEWAAEIDEAFGDGPNLAALCTDDELTPEEVEAFVYSTREAVRREYEQQAEDDRLAAEVYE